MKLSEVKSILLNEMPYERPGEMRRTGVSGAFISDNALKRKYSYLGFIEVFGNISVELHFHKSSQVVFGTIKEKDKDDFDSNQVIFSLMFKETNTLKEIPKKIDIKKILQVDKVTINEKFENFGVASFAYATLVNRGYTILSDIDQFSDGKELWKRMARRAHLRDYRIYILHDEHGFLEKDGKPIEYNASNIDDAEIWSKNQDYSKRSVLLLMSKAGVL